ncbi:hypothetical protein T484DRAFT_1806717 [Baffinella frigidus]|nr:hypothetical protein T484DRAFT_1806717 [Cryptophyta sp. CCMP2293]
MNTTLGAGTLGAVQGGIRATAGVAVEVGCNRAKDGTIQLYEIRACFAPMPSAKDVIRLG